MQPLSTHDRKRMIGLESESRILLNPGIGISIGNSLCGIRIGIGITGPGIIYNSDLNFNPSMISQHTPYILRTLLSDRY